MSNLKEFLAKVTPDGHPILFPKRPVGGLYRIEHETDLVKAVKNIASCDGNNQDCYFNLGRITGNELNKRGHPRLTQNNVTHMSCLVADIDTTENEATSLEGRDPHKQHYETKDLARDALKRFCDSMSIPYPPIEIDTGGGLQVYWPLEGGAVPVDQWKNVADRMHRAMRASGLLADYSFTSRSNVAPRMPGTHNHKYKPPLPVQMTRNDATLVSFATLDKELPPLLLSEATEGAEFSWPDGEAPPRMDGEAESANNKIIGVVGEEFTSEPRFMKHIVERCAVFAYEYDTGGEFADYESWVQILNTAKFCEDGEAWLGNLCGKHRDYDEANCLEKFNTFGNAGPTTCHTFSSLNDTYLSLCELCEYRNTNIKTPHSLGKLDDLPYGFSRAEDGCGLWQTTVVNKKPETVKVYDGTPVRASIKVVGEESWLETQWEMALYNLTMALPASALSETRKLTEYMLKKYGETTADPANRTRLLKFMTSWYRQLKATRQQIHSTDQNGWVFVGKKPPRRLFAYAEKGTLVNGRQVTTHPVPGSLSEYYKPTGQIAPWNSAVDMLLTDSRRHSGRHGVQVVLATAFAAPLIYFTDVTGVTLGVHSDHSGSGKSTAMQVAQAVWGHPVKGMNSMDDTDNAIAKKLSLLPHLPSYWDEAMTSAESALKVGATVFKLTQGKEKSRLSREADMRSVDEWKTMLVIASNVSIADAVSQHTKDTDAGVTRILEIPFGGTAKAGTETRFRDLSDNYGHAGAVYAEYLGRNQNDVEDRVNSVVRYLNKKYKTTKEQRFQVAGTAAIIVGAMLAKHLKLVDFDMGIVKSAAEEALVKSQETIDTHEELRQNVISNFIADNADNILITDVFAVRSVKPTSFRQPAQTKILAAQITTRDKKARIRADALISWCEKTGHQFGAVQRQMETDFGAVKKQGRLGVGFDALQTPRVMVWEIDITQGSLNDLIDGIGS